MYKKFNTFEENGFFNQAGVNFEVYYDPKNKMFDARTYDVRVPKRFIKTPHKENVTFLAWDKFWKSLDNESLALAQSHGKQPGFFQFMRDNGLIAFFDVAFAEAAEEVICAWERDNRLNIDWDGIRASWLIF